MADSKISIYSLADLKNTTDDALPNYLSSLKFQQSHFLTDVRLALGYSAVALTAAIFLLDRQYGWDKTKDLTLWAVIVYFVLNAVLNAWTMFVEKGQMFVGTKDGKTISITTKSEKYSPVYKIKATYEDTAKASSGQQEVNVEAPYSRWFTRDGSLIAGPLQKWLAGEVAPIGQAAAAKKAKK